MITYNEMYVGCFMECFSQLSDHDLIRLAQSGNKDAEGALISRYHDYIRFLVSKHDDKDELFSIALFAALYSIRNYKFDRGASFKTYLTICINSKLLTAKKTLNKIIPEIEPELSPSPEDLFIQNEFYNELIEKLQDALSPFELQIIHLRLDGYSYRKIAELINCDIKSVDNAIYRIKKKLSNQNADKG